MSTSTYGSACYESAILSKSNSHLADNSNMVEVSLIGSWMRKQQTLLPFMIAKIKREIRDCEVGDFLLSRSW